MESVEVNAMTVTATASAATVSRMVHNSARSSFGLTTGRITFCASVTAGASNAPPPWKNGGQERAEEKHLHRERRALEDERRQDHLVVVSMRPSPSRIDDPLSRLGPRFIDPAMVKRLIDTDYQMILPTLILERTPLGVQVLFFGALLSAFFPRRAVRCWRPR